MLLEIPVHKVKSYKQLDDLISKVVEIKDYISEELPLQIALSKQGSATKARNHVITMRTPGQDLELAYGFLLSEGIINSRSEILEVDCQPDKLIILLAEATTYDLSTAQRNIFTSSSCGVCSKTSLGDVYKESHYLPYSSTLKIKARELYGIQNLFRKEEGIFDKTGSLHSAILLNSELSYIGKWEDVGRHNAMDKLIGSSVLTNNFPLTNHVALLSGRISFELVQKAAMAGIPMIIAKGAPTSLAIEEAYAQSICLVGFSKDRSFNVYSGFERILD